MRDRKIEKKIRQKNERQKNREEDPAEKCETEK
jgi:hypothetical protein